MNIEFDVYKQKLNDVKPTLDGLADSLNLEGLRGELERYQAMQEAPGFWDDPDRSNKQMKELKNLKDTVGGYQKLEDQFDDILTLIQMGYEENDASLIPDIADELAEFKAWKDSQQTEEEKWNNLTKERDTANGRVAELAEGAREGGLEF